MREPCFCAGDLDGPEIARELVVSLNTVRTHTKNIYAKLRVNNRRAAVRRAEELPFSRSRSRLVSIHLPAGGCADLASRGLRALAVPAGDREVRAHHGRAYGGRLTDTSGATGD